MFGGWAVYQEAVPCFISPSLYGSFAWKTLSSAVTEHRGSPAQYGRIFKFKSFLNTYTSILMVLKNFCKELQKAFSRMCKVLKTVDVLEQQKVLCIFIIVVVIATGKWLCECV